MDTSLILQIISPGTLAFSLVLILRQDIKGLYYYGAILMCVVSIMSLLAVYEVIPASVYEFFADFR